ncbi:flagellar biosynthesis protein FlhF [Bacillus sp. BP-3]|uniref:flagellar biosynthesis protein FlhF n=1 Tax=Bacillus sp. BP-3 TaxID=3022773 RepID=UPI0023312294|nr:flagellar biosynthesis protein FlhF [Bacillus sp. BP-3]MDC2865778.1 flagellar biosynthesis protein FlhF [Bacillus sp. BP-3]
MESTAKKESIKRIQAESKSELYHKLFEEHENDYYYVIDEIVKRKKPFFWKKQYEMIVKFPEKNEEMQEQSEIVEEQSEEMVRAHKIQSILHDLENKTHNIPYTPKPFAQSEEWIQKKQKLLQVFDNGFVVMKTVAKQEEKVEAPTYTADETWQKKEQRAAVPFIIKKVLRTLEQNEVEGHFLAVYEKKLRAKFEHTSFITEEEVLKFILEDMRTYFHTENVFDKEVQTIALIGPTGVGKTTTLAKIAWQLYEQNKTVGFITMDHSRVGTVQQLQESVKIIGAEVLAVRDADGLSRALSYFKQEAPVDYILIDTAGRNYRTKESVQSIIKMMEQAQPDYICLTLSASMKSKDMVEIIANFKDIQISGLIFTKFDETASSGELLKIPAVSTAPIVFTTDGQDVTQHLHIATAEHLVEKMLYIS